MAETTAIRVSKETWRELSSLKNDPGDSFDDIVGDLLAVYKGEDEPPEKVVTGGGGA